VRLVHDFQESDDYALELAMAHEWFSPTILRGVDHCREAVSFCPFLGCRNVNCKYKCTSPPISSTNVTEMHDASFV